MGLWNMVAEPKERSEAHEIGEQGERLYELSLPSAWVSRKQTPDYHIDFVTEVYEAGNSTGEQFAAQVKASKRPLRIVQETLPFLVSVKDLAYYVDKQIHPVYLVVINPKTQLGYYLFLQEYALHELPALWRKQKNVTVRVPLKNELKNHERLLADVRKALKFMAGLRPGAVESALAAEEKRIESLDPRFRVELRADKGGRNYRLRAREHVALSFHLHSESDEAKTKFRHMMERGIPASFDAGEVRIEGLPAFAKFFDRPVRIQVARSMPAALSVMADGADGTCSGGLYGIVGKLEGGRAECRFRSDLSGCPLAFNVTFHPPHEGRICAEAKVLWRPHRWNGKSVLHLPHFEQITAIARAIGGEGKLHMELAFAGSKAEWSHRFLCPPPLAREMSGFLEFMSMAREVAQALRVNPTLPATLTRENVNELKQLHLLISRGEYKAVVSRARLALSLSAAGIQNLISSVASQADGRTVSVGSTTVPHKFLGETVNVPDCEITIACAKCVSDLSQLRAEAESGAESLRVEFEASKTEVTVRRHMNMTMAPRVTDNTLPDSTTSAPSISAPPN